MTLPVFVADGELASLAPGATAFLTGEEARHAVVVRRIREGERVTLTDGRGTRLTGPVQRCDKNELAILVEEARTEPPPQPAVTVVQAVPKGDRGERAVELQTEVGVDVIVPWQAERCVAVWKGDRVERSLRRWRAAAREAAKQSRRAWLPHIAAPATTEGVARLLSEVDLALVLDEEAAAPLGALDLAGVRTVLLVVGPEGGLSDDERRELTEAGAQRVRLGESVLRTSTAGAVGAAVLLSRTRWT